MLYDNLVAGVNEMSMLHMMKERRLSKKKPVFKRYPFFQVQYHEMVSGRWLAAIGFHHFSLPYLRSDFLSDIEQVMVEIANREDVKAVIFTGEEKVALPLVQTPPLTNDSIEENVYRVQRLFELIENLNKPVIAAVQRGALGHACEMLGAVHLVIADQDAIFATKMPGAEWFPSAGGTQRLPRLCQTKRGKRGLLGAVQLLVQGRMMNADEAWRTGLVDEISPEADVFKYAVGLAREYVISGEGLLHRSYVRHQAWMLDWELSKSFSEDIEALMTGISARQTAVLELIRYGYQNGFQAGLRREAEFFIQEWSEQQVKGEYRMENIADLSHVLFEEVSAEEEEERLQKGELLPPGVPFYPRFTPIPAWQYAYQVVPQAKGNQVRQFQTVKRIIPVEKPKAYEILVYLLASEVNYHDLSIQKQSNRFYVTGHLGLGLVVAVGEEVKREGWINIGEMVTVNLQKKPLLPVMPGEQISESVQKRLPQRGTHQQFAIAHIAQITRNNRLWEGYWDQRDLSIQIVQLEQLDQLPLIQMNEQDENDICVIQNALPRLNLMNSQELFQTWTEN